MRERSKQQAGKTHLIFGEGASRVDADASAFCPSDSDPERERKHVRRGGPFLLLRRRIEHHLFFSFFFFCVRWWRPGQECNGDGDEHSSALHAGVDKGQHGSIDRRSSFTRSRGDSSCLSLFPLALLHRVGVRVGVGVEERIGGGGEGKCSGRGRDGLEGELEERARVQVQEEERGQEGRERRFDGFDARACEHAGGRHQ